MAVNLEAPAAQSLLPIKGVRLGAAEANIRKPRRKDVLVIELAAGCRVAGVFTQNLFCAAPVSLCREHMQRATDVRALLVNTGNANAGTGATGQQHARTSCVALAAALGCQPEQVLPFSTGVILEPLPIDRLVAGLPACIDDLNENHWLRAAQTIMTTDTVPKGVSRQLQIDGEIITVTGIAKGSGMIHPNMATMLGYIATDAAVSQAALDSLLRHAVAQSFNCVTVDGDTSTNDSCMLIASGQTALPEINSEASAEYRQLRGAVTEVAVELAQAIVRDGEGASKFMTILVEEGRDVAECRQLAYTIAHSPLVKTAFFASDPNLGRILAAIGRAELADLDVNAIKLYLGDFLVAEQGGRARSYEESQGVAVMQEAEITVRIQLGRGRASATVWTCDLSHDYVSINADYRS